MPIANKVATLTAVHFRLRSLAFMFDPPLILMVRDPAGLLVRSMLPS
jgi:hypothetical protein